jgi:hypothetical protein
MVTTVTEPRLVRGDLADLTATPLLRPFASDEADLAPSDVEQGKIKNCCVAAVLGAMANTSVGRARIRSMIAFNAEEEVRSVVNGVVMVTRGLVQVSFGVDRSTIAISRLLYREQSADGPGEILYARSQSGQGWVSFIEKAYAVFISRRRKQPEVGYSSLVLVDPRTAMQDLLAPRQPPQVLPITTKSAATPTVVRGLLIKAGTSPTVATTPKAAGFNTPHNLMANHAYAVRGLQMRKAKGAKQATATVLLSCDEDEIALRDFIMDFDSIVTGVARG